MTDDDAALLVHQGTERLGLLEALAAGLDRHTEITAAVAASADRAEASRRVRAVLGVDDLGATAVLDLQWSRLTATERRRIQDEIDRQREALHDLRRRLG